VPSTKADDGEPLDIMVIHDAATFPGIVLTCRIIGILQIEQKSKGKAKRNDRLFAVPRRSHSEQGLRDVREISKPIQEELEKFFIATDELEDKKLDIIGWKGPKIAMKAIKDRRQCPHVSFRRLRTKPICLFSTPSADRGRSGRSAGSGMPPHAHFIALIFGKELSPSAANFRVFPRHDRR
jgi:hypothetical protein